MPAWDKRYPDQVFAFSKVGAIVILLSMFCSELTFENFQLHAQMGQTLSRKVLEKRILESRCYSHVAYTVAKMHRIA